MAVFEMVNFLSAQITKGSDSLTAFRIAGYNITPINSGYHIEALRTLHILLFLSYLFEKFIIFMLPTLDDEFLFFAVQAIMGWTLAMRTKGIIAFLTLEAFLG